MKHGVLYLLTGATVTTSHTTPTHMKDTPRLLRIDARKTLCDRGSIHKRATICSSLISTLGSDFMTRSAGSFKSDLTVASRRDERSCRFDKLGIDQILNARIISRGGEISGRSNSSCGLCLHYSSRWATTPNNLMPAIRSDETNALTRMDS